ncbi:MAG: terminase gpA endonuclease subunit [Planctomycetaceae bacterium]
MDPFVGRRRDIYFRQTITAEYFVKTEGRGRTVDEWKQRPEQPDNHWLDCLVGCAVAASIQGANLDALGTTTRPKRTRMTLQELARR